ncbi:MAG: hypothetical protein LBD20_10505 [Spirochaetaceae bacterium]|nr:hypothetical protein [Spirochaetaceae bacterium]
MGGQVCPSISSCNAFEAQTGSSGGGSSSGGGGFLTREFGRQKEANSQALKNFGDATGLGVVGDVAGGIGKAAKFAKEMSDKENARQAELERQKQEKRDALQPVVEGKYQLVNLINLDGDETVLLGGIGSLFGIIKDIKILCEEREDGEAALTYDDKWALFQQVCSTAWSKFDEALEKLQEQSSTGEIIGTFVNADVVAKLPPEFQKSAAKKMMERRQVTGMRSIETIQTSGNVAACTESIVNLFDIIDTYKRYITAESIVDKKERNDILAPVRLAAITKIDSALETLHGMSAEGNAIAAFLEDILAVEKNLKFSNTTGKFHDKDHMPLLANIGDSLAKLNPFAKKDKAAGDSASPSAVNSVVADIPLDSVKNKLGGLFNFGKNK